ncbi:hypothetical protein Bca52824_053878 [Brassica carinata]|uniref:Uncharacterized protein n=1 Tax=Brassica carinata TaxID=52824 RepID=A0A8X7R7F9_BRACI|nr:hypothetical protein Bca52824_053878 [Brassica carinata]
MFSIYIVIARMIIARANSASSEPPPEPFVVPSFMGPATEVKCSMLIEVQSQGWKAPLGCYTLKRQSIAKIHPVWEHQDEDPEIDNLLVFLRQDNSLSTITWQALSEYPLTPIECNKRRLVASQRKSKKSKKVASNGQDNIADGGENVVILQKLKNKHKALMMVDILLHNRGRNQDMTI